MKAGDKITITTGKLKGAVGVIEKPSVKVPGGFICRLTSLKPAVIKILVPSQIELIP